jgi:hypothetical protein
MRHACHVGCLQNAVVQLQEQEIAASCSQLTIATALVKEAQQKKINKPVVQRSWCPGVETPLLQGHSCFCCAAQSSALCEQRAPTRQHASGTSCRYNQVQHHHF